MLPPQQTEEALSFEHFSNPVIHLETGELITSFEILTTDPLIEDTWTKAIAMELCNIVQAHKATNTPDIRHKHNLLLRS